MIISYTINTVRITDTMTGRKTARLESRNKYLKIARHEKTAAIRHAHTNIRKIPCYIANTLHIHWTRNAVMMSRNIPFPNMQQKPRRDLSMPTALLQYGQIKFPSQILTLWLLLVCG